MTRQTNWIPFFTVALAATGAFNGCGIGTEIGNGLKPIWGEESDDNKSKGDKPSEKPLPMPADKEDQEGADSRAERESLKAFKKSLASALLTSCRSPLYEALTLPVTLMDDTTGKEIWSISRVDARSWKLSYDSGQLIWHALRAEDDASVKIVDRRNRLFDAGFTCISDLMTENNTAEDGTLIVASTVRLQRGSKRYSVTWITHQSPTASSARLKAFRVDGEDGDEDEGLSLVSQD